MRTSSFSGGFVPIFIGPVVWALHFLFVYVFAALACARRFAQLAWQGLGVVQWAVAISTALAVIAIATFMRRYGGKGTQDNSRFSHRTAAALGGLSIIAILWEALAAYLVPACT